MMTSPLAAKSVPLYLLELENTPIFEQLQLEEALLRTDTRNWCIINRGSPPAIVMGISGKPELLLNQELLAQKPIPVIRRFSGGGTVFIDHNTFFVSWICNADHSNIECCPNKLYQWSTHLYQQLLPSLNIQLVENDYVIDGQKFGGNAQYLCKGRWLHHSSLLWDYDSLNMRYLQMPPKAPKYRQLREHDDFLCRLNAHFKEINHLQKKVTEGISQIFDVRSVGSEELEEILLRPHRKGLKFETNNN